MHKRLYSFLCKYNCIYINQLGFRKHHSTIHALIGITEHIHYALIGITEHIHYALDNNDIACGIFIDLQKAFDKVDDEILLIMELEDWQMTGSNLILLIDTNLY